MSFVVDLEGLLDLVADLGTFDAAVERQAADLESEMSALHAQWTGEAASAQAQAHARLQDGLSWMRTGLAQMRQAGSLAHGNYSAAVVANQSMMDGLG